MVILRLLLGTGWNLSLEQRLRAATTSIVDARFSNDSVGIVHGSAL